MVRAADLRDLLSGTGGSGTHTLERVAGIEQADARSVVFATDPHNLERALASPAGLILANSALDAAVGEHPDVRVVWVPDARVAFARAAQHLAPPPPPATVHPTAVMGHNAVLGKGTSVGPGTVIEADVHIGEHCQIGPRVVIHRGTRLGDRVSVQAGAILGSTGFGYVRLPPSGEYLLFPQQGRLEIENDVEIGANTTIDRGALGETRIGQGSKLDNLVHIGHNVRIGRRVIIAAQTGVSGSSVIEDDAIIAGQVGIAEHVTIGSGVILGAKCGVPTGKKLRGPGEVFWGIPARPIRDYLRDLAKLRRS